MRHLALILLVGVRLDGRTVSKLLFASGISVLLCLVLLHFERFCVCSKAAVRSSSVVLTVGHAWSGLVGAEKPGCREL